MRKHLRTKASHKYPLIFLLCLTLIITPIMPVYANTDPIIGGENTADRHEFKKFHALTTGSDDAAVEANDVSLTRSSLYLNGLYGRDANDNYIRFADVDLPKDAVVTNAYMEFITYDKATPTNIAIAGELSGGAAFDDTVQSFTSRNFTAPTAPMQTPTLGSKQLFQTGNIADLMNQMRGHNGELNDFVFKITGDKSGDLRVRSYNYSSKCAPVLHYEYLSSYGKFTQLITDENNDSEEYGVDKKIDLDGSMQIGGYKSSSIKDSNKQRTAFRFTNVEIPDGAQVTNAYLEFTTTTTTSSNRMSNQKVRIEQGNPAEYVKTNGDVSSRDYSVLSVDYPQAAFISSKAKHRTPDLSVLINENRLRGWKNGQSLAFMIDGDGYIGAVYQGGSSYPPQLVVEYRFAENDSTSEYFSTDPKMLENVYINEVSSQGSSNSKEDWVEFYNANDAPVILGYHELGQPAPSTGMKLWRDTNRKEAYAFDNIIIPAKGFRIVYFDESPEDGADHADFDLKKNAELVLFSDADGSEKVIHTFKYPEHLYNQTFGLKQDGASEVVQFAHETFGATNNAGQVKYDISVSHDRGVYEQGFNLEVQTNPGVTIRYTTNGMDPSATAGTEYTRPISIHKSSIIKLYAYDDYGNSTVNTYSYILLNNYPNELARTVSGTHNNRIWRYKDTLSASEYATAMAEVPIVSVSSNIDELEEEYLPGTFEYLDSHLDGDNYMAPVGLKKYGQVSVHQYNHNTGIRFHRDYNTVKAEYDFFEKTKERAYKGSGEYPRLDLKEGQDGPMANVYSLGFMRYSERATQMLSGQMGKLNLETRYVHSFYNGEYMGVKTMSEHFNDNMMEEYIGGDSDDYTTIDYQDGRFTSGDVEEGNGDEEINDKVLDIAKTKNLQEFKKYVDVQDLIRTQILFMFTDTEREVTGVIENTAGDDKSLKMIFNINDTDGAFYNDGHVGTSSRAFAGGGGNYRNKWGSSTSREGAGRMFGYFSGDSTSATAGNLEFKTLVKDEVLAQIGSSSGDFKGANGAPLSVENVKSVLKQNQDELKNIYKLDSAFMSTYSDMYVRWTKANADVLTQVDDRVKYNLEMWSKYGMAHTLQPVKVIGSGSGITLTNPNSNTTVYYTLDGSDPMGANGTVSSSARTYTAGTLEQYCRQMLT